MTLDEEDGFIQQIMANCNTAMAAAVASTTKTDKKEKSTTQILSDPVGE
jgi:hypothetical protein